MNYLKDKTYCWYSEFRLEGTRKKNTTYSYRQTFLNYFISRKNVRYQDKVILSSRFIQINFFLSLFVRIGKGKFN